MEKPKIVIIGGGVAGLSAGIYAQLNGFDSQIIEMHDKPGGQLTSWTREGYRFDYCLHWLVGTDHGVFNDIWKETHAIRQDTPIINHEEFVRYEDEIQGSFLIYNNIDKWEDYLKLQAPEDKEAIHKLCTMMRKSDRLDQFAEPPGMRSVFDYLKAMYQMGSFFPVLIKYGKKTCNKMFLELGFKNERILYFLNKLFEGQDFSALGFIMMMGWAHAKNAGYLSGGSIKMAKRMAQRYHSLGGEFLFKHRVNEILVENNHAVGVSTDQGTTINSDYVIGACDLHTIFYNLLKGRYLPDDFQTAFDQWPLFQPLVMVGFGIDAPVTSASHNVNYIPYDPVSIGQTTVTMYSIMNRSSYDPSFAPQDHTTLLLQFESPWDIWENLSGKAYDQEKQTIEKQAKEIFLSHYPALKNHIKVVDVATPRTTVNYTGVWKGAYEGFMPSREVIDGLPMQIEGLKNLYLAGQWLFPGGGLPPAAQTGKWAIKLIQRHLQKTFVVS